MIKLVNTTNSESTVTVQPITFTSLINRLKTKGILWQVELFLFLLISQLGGSSYGCVSGKGRGNSTSAFPLFLSRCMKDALFILSYVPLRLSSEDPDPVFVRTKVLYST
jgi:hypothetical protein